jgi:diguanylate cyclase (GGDEF)-like protein/PAS domain S-box-containing protein
VAETLTGWQRVEALGRPLEEVFNIVNATTRADVENPMVQATLEGRVVGLAPNSVLVSRTGSESAVEDSASPIRDGGGTISGAVMVFRDVTVARAREKEMEHTAQHDSLTTLANRVLMKDRLAQAVALARREHRLLAVLFLDIDHFKSFNDTLGHAVGDQLLKSVAQRLVDCVRASDTVSRIGGDEFVILLPEISHAQDASLAGESILRAFDAPHRVGEHDLQVTLSIGIATCPADGLDPDLLMLCADVAMYHAKSSGRNCLRFYTDDRWSDAAERFQLRRAQ